MKKQKRVLPTPVEVYMARKNTRNYNLLKAAEELQELSLELTQLVTKPPKTKQEIALKNQAVIDEIGDSVIRIRVLCHMFDLAKINQRVNYKHKKYREYISLGYKKI